MWPLRLLLVLLTLLLVSPVQAVQNDYSPCVLVPFLLYDFDEEDETVSVGLRTRSSGQLYWQFYDRDGNRRFDTNFSVNSGRFIPLIWSSEAPDSLEGFPGYGLFCLDSNNDGAITGNDEPALAANVFLVQEDTSGDDDIAFIPTLGLDSSHLSSFNPTGWSTNPISRLPQGVDGGGTLDIQYLVNDGDADRTRVFIWTNQDPGDISVAIIDAEGANRGTLNLGFMEDNLTVFDLDVSTGIDAGAGFLRWNVPAGSGLEVFAFSIARAEDFGASQTLLGHGYNP